MSAASGDMPWRRTRYLARTTRRHQTPSGSSETTRARRSRLFALARCHAAQFGGDRLAYDLGLPEAVLSQRLATGESDFRGRVPRQNAVSNQGCACVLQPCRPITQSSRNPHAMRLRRGVVSFLTPKRWCHEAATSWFCPVAAMRLWYDEPYSAQGQSRCRGKPRCIARLAGDFLALQPSYQGITKFSSCRGLCSGAPVAGPREGRI